MTTKKIAARPTRVPVAGPRDILSVREQDPNYVYRWVNDTVGRIQRFLDAGYEIVNQDVEVGQNTVDRGSKLGSSVTRAVGFGVTSVLMRIPKEYYDEDQAAKAAEIDALEASMKQEAQEGRYGDLKISRK